MARGKLISKADGTEYEVEFDLTTSVNVKKEPVTGTVASGKHTFELTVKNDSAIPDGDYELHPEGCNVAYDVAKSGRRWSVL